MEKLKSRRANSKDWIYETLSQISGMYSFLHDRRAGKFRSRLERCYKCQKVGRHYTSMHLCGSCGNHACKEHSISLEYLCAECWMAAYEKGQQRDSPGNTHFRK